MLSRRDNRNTATRENGPVSKTDAHSVIARLNAGRRLGNNGDIRLVESFSDLPAPIQRATYQQSAGTKVKGFVHHSGLHPV